MTTVMTTCVYIAAMLCLCSWAVSMPVKSTLIMYPRITAYSTPSFIKGSGTDPTITQGMRNVSTATTVAAFPYSPASISKEESIHTLKHQSKADSSSSRADFIEKINCPRIVCYFSSGAQYLPEGGRFEPENVEATHCTHIIYAFATLNGNRLAPVSWDDETTPWTTGRYARVINLKKRNPQLKVLLAVGGWNLGAKPFSQMVASPRSRLEFIDTTIQFLRERHFDGLDLDWEYPTKRGSPPADRGRFTLLVKELREAFEKEAILTSHRLLLTAAVPAGKSIFESAYDIPDLGKYLDFANLMTYDLHGAWNSVTGHNSPLYPGPWEFGYDRYLNVDAAVQRWLQMGFPKDKLVVGVPFYGRSFTLAGFNTQVMAPVRGAGEAGRFTGEKGFVAYYEVCEYLRENSTVTRRTDEMRVPYLVRGGREWVSYDDHLSLATKVEYLRQNSYGGVMIWSIAMDDFRGTFCGQGKYPLMSAVRQACGLSM